MGVKFGDCSKNQWQFMIMFGSQPLNTASKRFQLSKGLFEGCIRSHHQISTLEDILPQLANAQVFSAAYVKNGYWHVPVDSGSQKLTTFETPFGWYCWHNESPLAFMWHQNCFKQRLHETIENLDGMFAVADDILTVGNGNTSMQKQVRIMTRN